MLILLANLSFAGTRAMVLSEASLDDGLWGHLQAEQSICNSASVAIFGGLAQDDLPPRIGIEVRYIGIGDFSKNVHVAIEGMTDDERPVVFGAMLGGVYTFPSGLTLEAALGRRLTVTGSVGAGWTF